MAIKKSKGKVFVGMSGGVDSSVTVALLKKEGYDVVGVFMKVWQPDFLPCSWRVERLDAMRVAAHLDIPFLTWDFEKEYKEGVADYMIAEYKAGRTPNPDVMCNREVKFGAFFRRAMKEGADFVATGHYVRTARVESRKLKVESGDAKFKMLKACPAMSEANFAGVNNKDAGFKMLKGIDESKDQSYFLWTLGQEQLSKTLFPVGGFKKTHVRALATKFGLPTAEKKDSQGLCFMGQLDMKDFLAHFIKEKEGSVLDEKGEVIGTHRGSYFYTLGERHGFHISKKGTSDEPYYVVAKDLKANTITVTHGDKKKPLECASHELQASQANFCQGVVIDTTKTYFAQVRYHGELHECTVASLNNKGFSLHLKKPAVFDAGQSVVLYDGDECVGGGVIE